MFSHFLPQFYLKGFAPPDVTDGEERYVWTMWRGENAWRRAYPKDFAAETDYYLVRNEADAPSQWVEKALQKVETRVANLVAEKLENSRLPVVAERAALAQFVGVQLTRVPIWREKFERVVAEIKVGLLDDIGSARLTPATVAAALKHAFGGTVPPMTLRLVTSPLLARARGGSMDAVDHRQLTIAIGFAKAEILSRRLLQMHWSYLVTLPPDYFIASDNPVSIARDKWGPKSEGYLDPPIEITCPLSRRVALLAKWESEPMPWLLLDQENVAELNRRTANHSDRFIVAPTRSCPGTWRFAAGFPTDS